jgi:hypothetical protein
VSKWGTSFAFSASVGGLLELRSEWSSWLTNKAEVHRFSATTLAGQAATDFYSMTKLCGDSTHLPPDPKYVSNRAAPFPACYGGDPSLCSKVSEWLQV